MTLPNEFMLFTIADEVNLALVWVSVSRAAYLTGNFDVAAGARTKARVAYFRAKDLLGQIENDKKLESILSELEALWLALDRLAELALRVTNVRSEKSLSTAKG